jgi:hypothetical protein
MNRAQLKGFLYLAKAEVQDFEKCQPGEWLVHTNDVHEAFDALEVRIYDAMGWKIEAAENE